MGFLFGNPWITFSSFVPGSALPCRCAASSIRNQLRTLNLDEEEPAIRKTALADTYGLVRGVRVCGFTTRWSEINPASRSGILLPVVGSTNAGNVNVFIRQSRTNVTLSVKNPFALAEKRSIASARVAPLIVRVAWPRV